ncbi:MAG: DUF1592 domain-containing protein [Planctomycetes bacterium]|nr:DUF1592 domain-containing protein [Planctomycetota bacterium]
MRPMRVLLELPILCLLVTGAAGIGSHLIPSAQGPKQSNTDSYVADDLPLEQKARSVLSVYCSSCHQSGRSGMDFDDDALNLDAMRRNRDAWQEVIERVRGHKMPPRRFPQPSQADRDALVAWVEQEVLQSPKTQAGPLMARRLQRAEYVNSMRDLLGVKFRPDGDFPQDVAHWSACETLPGVPSVELAKYRAMAEKLLDQAIAAELGTEESASVDDPDEIDPLDGERTPLFSRDSGCGGPGEQAREIITVFARRAFRKPADADEVKRLTKIFEDAENDGKSFHEGVRAALTEVLTSPRFLYRIETKTPKAGDPFELACRLSFFLWRTGPDDELLELAETGTLADNLEAQTLRLLRHPRSRSFAVDFADHWLSLGKIDKAQDLDENLRSAMRREVEEFFAAMVREDRGVLDFIEADFTFLNETLAKHYGISGIEGNKMRRVRVDGKNRGGLLGQAGVLTIASASHDLSVVRRGKWVVETVLGEAPIRPPAGLLDAFSQPSANTGSQTRNDQVALHRSNPACAECHRKLDGIGLALDHFDMHGAWRDTVANQPVVAEGDVADGVVLRGIGELKAYLKEKHSAKFSQALGESLLRFAIGRPLDQGARGDLSRLPENAANHQFGFSRIIIDVVQSPTFRERFGSWE